MNKKSEKAENCARLRVAKSVGKNYKRVRRKRAGVGGDEDGEKGREREMHIFIQRENLQFKYKRYNRP